MNNKASRLDDFEKIFAQLSGNPKLAKAIRDNLDIETNIAKSFDRIEADLAKKRNE